MKIGIDLKKRRTETVDRKVGRTSDRVGDLIDNSVTERVFKSTIKNPKIKI